AGNNIYQFVAPEVADFRKKQMEIVLKERKPLQFEDMRFGAWIENSIYPIFDADGEIRRVAIYGRDITERKLAEANLRKVENRAKALIENAPDGVALIGMDGSFTYVSPSGRKMFGYSADEGDLSHANDLTHPDDLCMVTNALSELIQNPALTPTLVYRFHHKNGSWIWIESTFTNLLADPGVEGIVINFRDITERKEAEQALRESEEHFRSLYQQSPIGLELYDKDGMLLDVNPASRQIFGVESVEDIKGLNLFNDPDIPESVKERILNGQAISYEYTFDFEKVHRLKLYPTSKTGKIELSCVITPWRNAQGGNGGYFLQIMDISEQKQAQDALLENQRRLATLLRNLPGMAFRCTNDPDWTMEFVSQGCYDLTGYYDHELLRNEETTYASIIHPDDRQMVWDVIEPRVANQQAYTVSYRIITPTGEEKWVWEQGQGVYDRDGELEALEGFISDITPLKRSENALRQNEALLQQSQAQANMGSFVWDLHSDALTWSGNMYAIHGLDGDTFDGKLGKVSSQLIHPEDRTRVAEEIGKMLAAKHVWPMEFRVIRPDGLERIMRSDGVFELDAQGQPLR
ncbi:MAG: PAS domain S-box protein, partial [Anaerolineaceae bacterium]|nr:PAS domain S-box protein [Anaerolineaceae bacterium]